LPVTAPDAAGNTSVAATSTYLLDTTAPPTPTITASPASPGNSLVVTWAFTTPPSSTTTCSLSRAGVGVFGVAPCSGSVSYDLTGQPDGTYTLSVVATDTAGNASPAATATYLLDTTPPVAPAITAAPVTPGNRRSPARAFLAEAGGTLTCSLTRGGVTVFPAAPCTSPKSFDLTGQPDGTYTFTVTATDAAGNTSVAATSTYLLDTTPPVAPAITASPVTPGNGRSPAWTSEE